MALGLLVPGSAGAIHWSTLEENLRANLELVSRIVRVEEITTAASYQTAGLDIHSVLSGRRGDIGTVVLQPYIVRRDNALSRPPHIEGMDDWEVEFHQSWFNLTRFGRGRTNIRVGHMLVPYGLEPGIDTHMALRQTIAGANLGTKMDWGLSLNGTPRWGDYEIALLRGSGMEWRNEPGNFAFAGRWGKPFGGNFTWGLSGYHGLVFDPMRLRRYKAGGGERMPAERLVRRTRSGIDLSFVLRQFGVLSELSVGRDYEFGVLNGLAEVNWTSREESVFGYARLVVLSQDADSGWSEDVMLYGGFRWRLNSALELAGQVNEGLVRYLDQEARRQVRLQARVRL